jgi:ribosomal protein S12 methylthiotransferase accessory factor
MSQLLESEIVNQRTGFFRGLVSRENFLRPLRFHVYVPDYSLGPHTSKEEPNPLSISGAGMSSEEAKAKCIGEAIERYCWYHAGFWIKETRSKFKKIRKKSLAPENYGLFSDSQYAQEGFPFIPFREDTELHWVEGVSLDEQKPFYVPARLCYPGVKDRTLLSYCTTTGLACSDNYFNAVYTAICEVIERDAFMLMWTNRIKPRLMEIQWPEEYEGKKALEYLRTSRYSCFIFSLCTDVDIPVIFTVMVNKEESSPYFSCGMACDLNMARAVRKSISESLHNLNFLIGAVHNNIRIKWEGEQTNIRHFDDHALLYANPCMKKEVSFILAGPHIKEKTVLTDEEAPDFNYEEGVRRVIKLLDGKKYQPVVIDLTPKEIKKRGFHIIKILIPGLIDLGFNKYYWLGNKRIYEVPGKLGFRKLKEADINTAPHPFP